MKDDHEKNKERASVDMVEALEHARQALKAKGMKPSEIDAQAFMAGCAEKAKSILLEHLEEHERLRLMLLKHGRVRMGVE